LQSWAACSIRARARPDAEAPDAALKIDFKALPFDRAVKTVRGNGSRVLVTFEDPNCPYCKKLWQNMSQLNNVTIYTFLYPILSPDSHEKSKAIWARRIMRRAWDDYMVQGKRPQAAAADCKNPLEQNVALGRGASTARRPSSLPMARAARAIPVERSSSASPPARNGVQRVQRTVNAGAATPACFLWHEQPGTDVVLLAAGG
jgi:hypothetical protein